MKLFRTWVLCSKLRRQTWRRFALACNRIMPCFKHPSLCKLQSFRMIWRWKGVSPQNSDEKQGGEGGYGNGEPPKIPAKPIVKKEPKGTEKLIEDEPIIDDDKDVEPDEVELKEWKARDTELNETQRIIKEAEEKERA
ncbi:unnamed protein product [Lactuca saligna]|uniref:Uncharacterized protein n=1 Tax=Lactuca saligna TaxID=75948 RepID=A0AA36A329_LACSI|nr:unnamed protein product [Lactuca saligna]